MNIVTAERTQESAGNDSRNGAGKTSLARILRYLLGGTIAKGNPLKNEKLADFSFSASFTLPDGEYQVVRPVRPMTRIRVNKHEDYISTWKELVGKAYGLNPAITSPTLGELVSQTIRTEFNDPIKTESHNPDWKAGVRLGYFLGLSPFKLTEVKKVKALKSNQNNIKKAIREGALPGFSLDATSIQKERTLLQQKRDMLSADLEHYKVDEQYREHQEKADKITRQIRDLNEDVLSLMKRKGDLQRAINDASSEVKPSEREVAAQIKKLYAEMQVILPDSALQRYEDVLAFHNSVARNRGTFLQDEYASVSKQLNTTNTKIESLGVERAALMEILETGMALETFQKAQQEIQDLDGQINELSSKLDLATSLKLNESEWKNKAAIARNELHSDITSLPNKQRIKSVIDRFAALGNEIYRDRKASLSIKDDADGLLRVSPSIEGDASAGIKQVEMFLLDMVFLTNAMELGRSPKFIFHDSRLFDSMDSRQLGSCLNIGARLAEEIGFQYVVTINSDNLQKAEGFEIRDEYKVEPTLTDHGDDGGLFGFRF
nr:DUF2326 domain-containing protein [Bifidobacterium indicum]